VRASLRTDTLSLHDALPISVENFGCSKANKLDAQTKSRTINRFRFIQYSLFTMFLCKIPESSFKRIRSGDHNANYNLFYQSGFRSEEHTSELQSRFDLVCRL